MRTSFAIYVLTTDTDHGETEPYPGIVADQWGNTFDPAVQVCYLRKKGLGASKIKQQIDAIRPDFIYLNHLFSPLFVVYPLWLKYRGKTDARVVLSPRGALYDSALAVKRWKKTPFLLLFRLIKLHKQVLFHATNLREKEAILQHFPGSRVVIADNLPNMNQAPFQSIAKQEGRLRCILIARIVPIKNLLFLLKALTQARARIELTIVGPIEDKSYWAECQEQIGRLPENVSVDYTGPKRNEELPSLLWQHHLFVLPTTGENFGHSIFEAFLAGRPVLISDQTPWLGLAAQKAGWDLSLADPAAFTAVIDEMASWTQDRFDEYGRSAWEYARRFINNAELRGQYLKLFE
jgi:glycosyltransferase involved in cell wall biosynthesis